MKLKRNAGNVRGSTTSCCRSTGIREGRFARCGKPLPQLSVQSRTNAGVTPNLSLENARLFAAPMNRGAINCGNECVDERKA